MHPLRFPLASLFYLCLRVYWKIRRPIVLGSRVIAVKGPEESEEVLLVRLSYARGWYLPGGGVDRGESFQAAALRELREECGVEAERARLFGLYLTRREGKIDHVAVFVMRDACPVPNAKPDPEILESRYFPIRALPDEATPATRRRIAEYLGEAQIDERW